MILHDLYERIKDQCTLFYPFFYQRNRDDTRVSAENQIDGLHFLPCFARRPKTNDPNSSYSVITFRSSLFENTNYFSRLGIPTIVGAPIGSSVDKIGFGSKCYWFQLYPERDDGCLSFEFMNGELCSPKSDYVNLLSDNHLRELVIQTPTYSWNEILSIVREWHFVFKSIYPTALFNTFPGQKPVFVVYK